MVAQTAKTGFLMTMLTFNNNGDGVNDDTRAIDEILFLICLDKIKKNNNENKE